MNEFISRNHSVKDMVKDSTGGSTGRNIHFYEDKEELSNRFAAGVRSDSWAGLNVGEKYAQIWGSSLDLGRSSFLKKNLDKVLLRRLFISSFDLSDHDIDSALKKIRAFKPKVIIGYPTPLYRIAKYMADNDADGLEVAGIISSAETLFDHQRKEVEAGFKCRVFNRYGCREFGVIAAECEEHNGLHLFTDRVLVEFLDIRGMENDPKKEIVITDLNKYGMPFLRYRIGDVGVPSSRKCGCGRAFPVMESVEGRTFDLIMGANGNFIAGTFWTLLFRSAEGIKQFQVVQPSIRELQVSLEIEPTFDQSNLQTLEKTIKKKCGDGMSVVFRIVPKIPVTESGKFRFIISDVARNYFKN
jgi:phenylacetate-CoA ligase